MFFECLIYYLQVHVTQTRKYELGSTTLVLEDKLGNDLVGAGEIYEFDVREVYDCGGPRSYLAEVLLDTRAHRDPCGTGDQAGISL